MLNKNKLEKIYLKVIEYGTYLALLTPFIFFRDYFFPFVVPKTIFFRIIVDVIFIAYVLLAFSNPKYRPRITPLTLVIVAFLGVIVLASVFGVNFERSFWSVFERMEGLLTFFHLFAFYIVLTSCFRQKKDWEKILSVSVFIGVFLSLYALTSNDPTTRGGATLGNSSFFSAYVLFNFFFALILFFIKTGVWRILYGLALVVSLASLFFNPGGFTKGAVAAFFLGIFFLLFAFLISYSLLFQKKKLRNIVFLFFLFSILGAVFSFQLGFVQERAETLWQSSSVQARLVVWDIAWHGWQERFWLGWGPENFNVPFAKHFDPELPLTHDIWYDRVHNIILDTGISSGVVGLSFYFSIFVVAIFGLFKFLPRIRDKKNLIVPLATIALLLAYFLQNLWVFDMVSSHMMFFLSLAFVYFLLYPREEEEEEKEKTQGPLSSFVASFLIVLTIIAFFFGNIQPARSSKLVIEGLSSPLEKSIVAFQKALAASPMAKFEIPEHFSTRITNLASQAGQDRELLVRGFEMVEKEFKKSIDNSPLDFRLHLLLGRHYNNFYQFSGKEESLILAEEALEKAFQLSPNNQQIYFLFAQTRALQGNQEEALNLMRKAADLEPRFFQARMHLVRTYREAGKYESALLELEKIEEDFGFAWQDNPETLKQGLEILRGLGEDINDLLHLYEKAVELNPKDINLWQGLVNTYIEAGEMEKARNALNDLSQIYPDLAPQIEEFLRQLKD